MDAPNLTLEIPERCPSCAATGAVRLQQTIRGRAVVLNWCCARCQHEWPIDPDDVPNRLA